MNNDALDGLFSDLGGYKAESSCLDPVLVKAQEILESVTGQTLESIREKPILDVAKAALEQYTGETVETLNQKAMALLPDSLVHVFDSESVVASAAASCSSMVSIGVTLVTTLASQISALSLETVTESWLIP